MAAHTLKDLLQTSGVDTLAADITSGATSFTGNRTPSDTNGAAGLAASPSYVVVWEPGTANEESGLVTAVNSGTKVFTVTRDLSGTGAKAHLAGSAVKMLFALSTLQSLMGGGVVPLTQAFGDAAAEGSASEWSRRDHKHGMPANPLPLTTASAKLGADVNVGTNNTFADGPSVSLAAGTWRVTAGVTLFQTTGTGPWQWSAKLWDGTTVAASGQVTEANNSSVVQIVLSATVVLAGSATWKISATVNTGAGAGSNIKAALLNNSAGNTASWIYAEKIG